MTFERPRDAGRVAGADAVLPAMRVVVAYTSLSGNTRQLARMIAGHCQAAGHAVRQVDVDLPLDGDPDVVLQADLHLLGSWSDNGGRTPPEMKRFIARLVDVVGMPAQVGVFGTGETQWGEEFFCGAVRRIAGFFRSPFPRLEIEQMPHGAHDALAVERWTRHLLSHARLPACTP